MSVDYETMCARCLADIKGRFTHSLEKTVAPRDLLGELNEYKLDDYAIIEDGFLDMDKHLIEELEVEFPLRFLCKEDCRGLCQRCGKNLNDGDCNCSSGEIDPRLLPLQKILMQMKEEEKTPVGAYEVSMNTKWIFADGASVSENAFVENSTANTNMVYFIITINNGEEVYHSPYMEVGSYLENIQLDKDIPKGDYDAVITWIVRSLPRSIMSSIMRLLRKLNPKAMLNI